MADQDRLRWGSHGPRSGMRRRIQRPLNEFSWREPGLYSAHLGYEWDHSPLPDLVEETDTSIPRYIHAMLSAQLEVMSIMRGRPIPGAISLDHIMLLFKQLNRQNRTIRKLLEVIARSGIVKDGEQGRIRNRRVFRYKFSYSETFDPSDLPPTMSFAAYVSWVQRELLRSGPLMAEIIVVESVYAGSNGVFYDNQESPDRRGSECDRTGADGCYRVREEEYGHVIMLTGWGNCTEAGMEDVEVWEYLNSKGILFGRDGGFGEIRRTHIHYVHKVTMVVNLFPARGCS